MNNASTLLPTAKAQAEALGMSRWFISAMRIAGRQLGDPVGRFTTRAWLMAWLRRHPDFVACHYLGRTAKPQCSELDHLPATAGKSGEQPGQRDQRRP